MRKNFIWYSALFFVVLVWGSFYPISKYIVTDVDPLLMSFLRYALAVVPMTPLFLLEIRKKAIPPGRDLLSMGFLGIVGITGFALFLFFGIKLSTSMNSSILINSQPIIATLIAPFFTSERFTLRQFTGALIGLLGMSFVVTGGDFKQLSFSDVHFIGNLFGLFGSISLSIYYIGLKKHVTRYGSIIPTYITMLIGTAGLFLIAAVNGARVSSFSHIMPHQWWLILYLGVIATAVVYLIFNLTLDKVGVIKAMGFKLLVPVFGVVLSIIFLGEKGGAFTYLGTIVVIVSILLIQFSPKEKNK